MGKKRKIISHPQFWNKFADHPAVKARQAAEEPVKVEPKPEPKVEAKKVEVKKVEPKVEAKKVEPKPEPKVEVKKVEQKPEPKLVITKPAPQSTVQKKVVSTKKEDKKSV